VVIFVTMQGKCLDPVGTKFGLIAQFLHYLSVCCVFSPIYSSFIVAELQTSGLVRFYHIKLKKGLGD